MRRGRIENRTLVGSLGQLELLGNPHDSECAWIENISDHGARVITRRVWQLGERLLLTSRLPPFCSTTVRVVYCQILLDGLYAIGCESTLGGVLQLLPKTTDSHLADHRASQSSAADGGFPDPVPAKS